MDSALVTGDCVEGMSKMPDGSVNLAFVDPPYNIGFDYGEDGHKDNMRPEVYSKWCNDWMAHIYRVLAPTGAFWLTIGDEWVAELKVMATHTFGFKMRSWVVWYYTFGVNCTQKFTRSHAHLLYFTKHQTHFTFHPDQVRVPSARALVYNDKRANPKGRLPDDTWILRPQDLPEGFAANSDTWSFPRVCGTFKQRQDGAANQLPEQLLGRIIRACSNEGDLVLDPMAGTGTTLAVAKKLNRRWYGFENVPRFSKLAQTRIDNAKVGAQLD